MAGYVRVRNLGPDVLGPRISEAVLNATGRHLDIGGAISIGFGFPPVITAADVRLRNPQGKSAPDPFTADRMDLETEWMPLLLGDVMVKRLTLTHPVLRMETGTEEPAAFLKFLEKTSFQTAPDAVPESISLANGLLTVRNAKTGDIYRFDIHGLSVDFRESAEPATFSLQGGIRGDEFSAKGRLGSYPAFVDPAIAWPLSAEVSVGNSRLRVSGSVKDPLAGEGLSLTFEASGLHPETVRQVTGYRFPWSNTTTLSGHISGSLQTTCELSELIVTNGKNRVEGKARFDLSGKRVDASIDLFAEYIDLRPFFKGPDHPAPEHRGEGKGTKKTFSNHPLPFAMLNRMDADFRISSDRLLLPMAAADHLLLEASLVNGHLNVGKLSAQIAGGGVDAALDVQAGQDPVLIGAKMRITQLSLSELTVNENRSMSTKGTIDLTFAVAGNGPSIAEIMASLEGNAEIRMVNGWIANEAIEKIQFLGKDFVTGFFRLFNPLKKDAEASAIDCLSARLDIEGGVADAKAIIASTPDMIIAGNGWIDLNTEELAILLKPTPRKGLGVDEIAELHVNIGQLTRPMRLQGTLTHPSFTVDSTPSPVALGKILGGLALFGPAGVAAGFLDLNLGKQPDPCSSTIAEATENLSESGTNRKESLPPSETNRR